MAKFLRKEEKKSHFLRNMVIYSFFMAALIGVGLYFFWHFIAAYEASLPNAVLAEYENDRLQRDFQNYLSEYAKTRSTAFQSEEELYEIALGDLNLSGMKLKKDAQASSDEIPAYAVRLDKDRIGTVTLKRMALDGMSFGMRGYAVDQVSFDYDPIRSGTCIVTAPKEAQISVNGVLLTGENAEVVNVRSIFSQLTEGYLEIEDVKYAFPYVGTPNLTASGKSDCTYPMESTSSGVYVVKEHGNVSAYEGLEQEAKNFVQDYVVYLSGSGSYGQVLTHILPDTSFRERIVSTIGGSLWAKGVTYGIQNFEMESVTPWGDGVIVTCHYQISYQDGDVFNGNMYILYVRSDNAWRVFNIEMF